MIGRAPDGFSSAVNIDCKLKNVSMVIDDTGSMGEEIGSIVSALTEHINSQPEDEYTKWNLTTFKDGPSNVGTTEDRSQILSLVRSLTASGGGDCPEDVLGGISTGLNAHGNDSSTNKQMLVATDAAAKVGDVDGIIANAQASGVRVNVLLTGDCATSSVATQPIPRGFVSSNFVSSQVVLKRIADETGGKYFFIEGGTAEDFKAPLNEIFATIANPPPSPPVDTTPIPSSPSPSSDGGGCTLGRAGDVMLPTLFLVVLGLFVMSIARRGPKGDE